MKSRYNNLNTLALVVIVGVSTLAGCPGYRFIGVSPGPANVGAITFSSPPQADGSAYTRCFPHVRIDITDDANRAQIANALGELCEQFNDPRFAPVMAAQPLWQSAPDDACETVPWATLWRHTQEALGQDFSIKQDDSASPASTGNRIISIRNERIDDWTAGTDSQVWGHRARLINTLSHELVHLRPGSHDGFAYADTDGSRNDYVRLWLASYRFGDANECLYLARHSTDFDGVFQRCFEQRFNDMTLGSPSRSGYHRACSDGDRTCLDAVESLSWVCRRQIYCGACAQ